MRNGRFVSTALRSALRQCVSFHFFGEVSDRRPWAKKREDRPAAFAGRSTSRSSIPVAGIPALAYTGEYPIPPVHPPPPASAGQADGNLRNQPEGSVRMSREKIAARYSSVAVEKETAGG
jgi:hypothetical protein